MSTPLDLGHTIALLERTPAALDALLRGLPSEWLDTNDGPGTWSVSDVVTHLIHTERTNWMPRVRMIMTGGDNPLLPQYDRHAFEHATQASLADRLDDLARLRREGLEELRAMHLQPEDFDRRARHPTAGPVTLSQVLATWPTHDLTHLHQISRVMAGRYRDAVGAWRVFLGVLRCEGHGD
jgi:hypothetical protein